MSSLAPRSSVRHHEQSRSGADPNARYSRRASREEHVVER